MEFLTFHLKCFVYFCIIFGTLNNHLITGQETDPLEVISDDELVTLIQTEKYVVVLFDKSKDSKEWTTILASNREELENRVDASIKIVKVVNSKMKKLYSSSKETVIVFFRHGIPLLYDGPKDADEILFQLIDNKEPVVRELTDETFEHLTQASSGATTGAWFIMFHDTCVSCQRMSALWEAVGAKLKQKINVAKINKATTGTSTARRFNVQDVPEFILFKEGKMYRYQIPKYDVNSFAAFAMDWYKNARAEKVPVPQSPFDDLTQVIANFLRGNPWIMKLGSICICVLVIVTTASKLLRKSEAPQQKKDK